MAGRHRTAFLVWMGVYSLIVLIDGVFLPKPIHPDAVHVLGALAPVVPLVFAQIENIRGIRAMDELDRRIHVEGMIVGVFGTMAITLTVGFLQWLAGVPTFSVGWVFPLMALLYSVGVFIGRRRYA
jgi:hypothetical protein